MDMKVITGGVTAAPGFEAAGVVAGIKKNGKRDLAVIYSVEPALTVGTFTRNKFAAAPVELSRKHVEKKENRAVVVNSGCANACTGEKGYEDASEMAGWTAEKLGLKDSSDVLVASTGVIGEYLPMAKIKEGINKAVLSLTSKIEGGQEAAEAIMTTDTASKEYACQIVLDDSVVTIGGMAKGSGMIHPNMATMLAFITSDVDISYLLLIEAFKEIIDFSFNMITVDGDTSTNDMALFMANGKAGNPKITEKNHNYYEFLNALKTVCQELAKKIVKDGEGATKFIEVKVKNCPDISTGKALALGVLDSNLVKTAFFGEDANWGRIVTAMGNSGVDFFPEKVDIYLGDMQVASKGRGIAFNEDEAKKILEKNEIYVIIDLNMGKEDVAAWGCDLSHEYVTINGSYRS